ncbi:MAG: 30S ribosomal protein S9 [Candidatus Woesearchaeota archaeon]
MKSNITSGKRKRAIATATIKPGKGRITINRILLENYSSKMARMKIMEPLLISGMKDKIDISVKVKGGGEMGQADAVRLSIARAILEFTQDKNIEKQFLDYDRQLLVADIRRKETRKPNDSKARAKRQKSYR